MLGLAQIKPGQKILDTWTGIGETAIMTSWVVGDKRHVVATDISPQMLTIGSKARSQSLQNIEFREGEI